MGRPGGREESFGSVDTSLMYLVDTGEKPVSHSNAPARESIEIRTLAFF